MILRVELETELETELGTGAEKIIKSCPRSLGPKTIFTRLSATPNDEDEGGKWERRWWLQMTILDGGWPGGGVGVVV